MADTLQGRIAKALSQVKNPRTGQDVLSSDKVRDIATTTTGKVRVSLVFEPGDAPTLARTIRQALEKVDGVTEASVNVVEASIADRGSQTATDGSPSAPRNPQ